MTKEEAFKVCDILTSTIEIYKVKYNKDPIKLIVSDEDFNTVKEAFLAISKVPAVGVMIYYSIPFEIGTPGCCYIPDL